MINCIKRTDLIDKKVRLKKSALVFSGRTGYIRDHDHYHWVIFQDEKTSETCPVSPGEVDIILTE